MNNASVPVKQALLDELESVLEQGETISSLVDKSIRWQIAQRRNRREFIARGLQAGDEARRTGEYYPADEVLRELDEMLVRAEPGLKDR